MKFGQAITLIRSQFSGIIDTLALTDDRAYNLPDKSGTIALLDDVGGNSFSEYIDVVSSRNIQLSDAGKMLACVNVAPVTLTLKEDAIANFPVSAEIEITQDSAGDVWITKDPSVTLWGDGRQISSYQIFGRFSSVTLKKKSANNWRIYGAIAW